MKFPNNPALQALWDEARDVSVSEYAVSQSQWCDKLWSTNQQWNYIDENVATNNERSNIGNCLQCHRICPTDRKCSSGHSPAPVAPRAFYALDQLVYMNPALTALALCEDGSDLICHPCNSVEYEDQEIAIVMNFDFSDAEVLQARNLNRVPNLIRDFHWFSGLSAQGQQDIENTNANDRVLINKIGTTPLY